MIEHMQAEHPAPITYHIMLRAVGDADFKRAGAVRLATQPPQGSVVEIEQGGRKLRATVEAVFIPPGCEENCIGTIFVAEI